MTSYKIKFDNAHGARSTAIVEANSDTDAEAQVKKEHPDSYVTSVEEVYGQVTYAVEQQDVDKQPLKRTYGYVDYEDAERIADAARNLGGQHTYVVIERTQTGTGTYTEREV